MYNVSILKADELFFILTRYINSWHHNSQTRSCSRR